MVCSKTIQEHEAPGEVTGTKRAQKQELLEHQRIDIKYIPCSFVIMMHQKIENNPNGIWIDF